MSDLTAFEDAWDEAEEALPEGWTLKLVTQDGSKPGDETRYAAFAQSTAYNPDGSRGQLIAWGDGSKVTCLREVARILKERQA
jgi:hypothetical protein